jgi:NAD(P)-dependent dehydrogenase (short-subunit alcohol dehydrogenase family)
MSGDRILVTGATDGLGLSTARDLVARGHRVVVHARNGQRASRVRQLLPDVSSVVVADAARFSEVHAMATAVAAGGPLDAIVHNVGVGYREPRKTTTVDGHAHVLQVNVLTPYLLTVLLPPPQRLVWLSSGLHRDGDASVLDLDWNARPWDGFQAYADSKLFDATLAAAFAERWPSTISNAVEPGWVATKMGGPGAPDDLALAHVTQVWLAEGADPDARSTGGYWYHQRPAATHAAVHDRAFQEALLAACADLTGITVR